MGAAGQGMRTARDSRNYETAPPALGARINPGFVCVGPERTGTSWLYVALSGHPEIAMPPVKEIRYFYDCAAYPGETLEMTARADRNFGSLYTYEVEAMSKRKVIAEGTLTLAMMQGKL